MNQNRAHNILQITSDAIIAAAPFRRIFAALSQLSSVFTNKLPIPNDLKEFAIGIFDEGELFSYYEDWKILQQKSFIDEDEHDGGIKHRHAINKIVAQKNIG